MTAHKPYNLFLDDVREPHVVGNYINPVELRQLYRLEHWVIVRDYKQFTDYISRFGLPAMISFDHDLADEHYGTTAFYENLHDYYMEADREMTGYDAAKWLVDYCIIEGHELPTCFCHSMNPVGKENILNVLKKKSPTHC